MHQLLQESEALRPQALEEDQPVLAETLEPLDLSFVEELRREPSDRDRRIHAAIDGEQRDPADVAAEFELAEGTVRNIVRRVRRWKGESHDLIEMSSLDMLLAHYDQLKWQSRQLKLAWEYSAATREFVDRTFYSRRNDPEQKHEREQVRRVESRGPNERYMRLHDHVREKMLKVGREVQELKARQATERARAVASPRSETAAQQAPPQTTTQPAPARPRPMSLRALAEIQARFGKGAAEAKEMPQESAPVQTVKRKKSKSERRLSKREKRLLKQSKYLRKGEPARAAAGDTTGHSQQGVIAAMQAAMAQKVTTPQFV